MNWILDAVIVAIIITAAIIGAKKGFVKTVIGMVCFFLVIILSFTLSSKTADIIYNNFVEEKIVSSMSKNLDNAGFNVINAGTKATSQLVDIIENTIEESSFLGVSPANQTSTEEISESISDSEAETAEELAKELSIKLVKPLMIRIMETFLFFVLFLLLSMLVKPVTTLVNKMFSFSIIGKLNKLLGGISGIFIGIVISVAFVNIFNNYVNISETEILGITPQTLNDTYLFSTLLNLV